MKKLYFLLPALFLFTASFGQTYYPMLDSVNTWSYATQLMGVRLPQSTQSMPCFYPIGAYSNTFTEFTLADTLIDSTWYKPVINSTVPCTIGYMREDTAQRKVYFLDNLGNPEIVLYDFSMQVGDTITLNFYPGGYTSGVYTLDSIVNVSIYAGTRRAFYLSNPASPWAPVMEWIESMGCPTEVFYPYFSNSTNWSIFNSCPGVQHQFDQFVACFVHLAKVYDDPCAYQVALSTGNQGSSVIDSCDYYNFQGGINENSLIGTMEIFPNPSKDISHLSITLKKSLDCQLLVFDAEGKNLLRSKALGQLPQGNSETELNLDGLPAGFYLVELKTAEGGIYRKLLVRE